MTRTMLALIGTLALVGPARAQFLPDAVQDRERKLWEATGVPFVDGMRFYKLTPVSQDLFILNNTHVWGIHANESGRNNVNRLNPWVAPGGLSNSPREQWRNATGVKFGGPVQIIHEVIDIPTRFGSQKQHRDGWRFADGTVFADMLVRVWPDGREQVFELRLREKANGKWDEGVAYRPVADVDDLPFGSETYDKWRIRFESLAKFGVGDLVYTATTVPPSTPLTNRPFVESKVVATADDDNSFVPQGYMGPMTRCVTCHGLAGKPTSYAEKAIRGDDTILSWHPWTLETLNTNQPPKVDKRWNEAIALELRHPPKPPPKPDAGPVKPPEPRPSTNEVLQRLEALTEAVSKLKLEKGPKGDPGPVGPPGERGPQGPQGDAGMVDKVLLTRIAQLEAEIAALKAQQITIDYDVLAVEVIKRLPPPPEKKVYYDLKPHNKK